MFTDTLTLLDRTIDDLDTLSNVFSDELDEHRGVHEPNARSCEEAIAAIQLVLPRLRAARVTQALQGFRGPSHCVNCD